MGDQRVRGAGKFCFGLGLDRVFAGSVSCSLHVVEREAKPRPDKCPTRNILKELCERVERAYIQYALFGELIRKFWREFFGGRGSCSAHLWRRMRAKNEARYIIAGMICQT